MTCAADFGYRLEEGRMVEQLGEKLHLRGPCGNASLCDVEESEKLVEAVESQLDQLPLNEHSISMI